MELRHLRYFVTVAEELHFGRAARRLQMAQPPLSQQIRQLESELGVTLLRRTTRRVELTPAGAAYLSRVRALLGDVESAGEEARRIASGLEGNLVVGGVGSATYTLLPRFARAMRTHHPSVGVAFRGEMLVPDQLDALAERRIDIGLLRPPVDRPRLDLRSLRRDRLTVLVPAGHRFAGAPALTVRDLAGEELIAHASARGSVMHSTVCSLCAAAGVPARIAHEVAETSTLVTFVAAGLGIAVVPEPTAALAVPGVLAVPLAGADGGPVHIELMAATRTGDRNAVIPRALDVLEELAAGGEPIRPPGHGTGRR